MEFLTGDVFTYPAFDGQGIVWLRAEEKWVRVIPWDAQGILDGDAVVEDDWLNGHLDELKTSNLGVNWVLLRGGKVLEKDES